MAGDISIDIGAALPYAVDSVLRIFGRDVLSTAARSRLEERVRSSLTEASTIQSVGMSRPVPIDTLYQPTRFRSDHFATYRNIHDATEVLGLSENLVVWGPPGAGKSVFLKHAYLSLVKGKMTRPILFQLRQSNAIDDLSSFISDLRDSTKFKPQSCEIALLIDGYDEISIEQRRIVSTLLKRFTGLHSGYFVMTCRLHYELIDLVGRYFWIEPFSAVDALAYVTALLRTFNSSVDAGSLLDELRINRFDDFVESPLMLTLVCILKTGSLPHLPRSTIGLIRRAIDTLTFRWDESRGIAREGHYPLDGEERIRCLMRIAFAFPQSIGPESKALACAQEHMKLIRRSDINVGKFLIETAQWYGLFVPANDGQWTFTHRTIHDYLAARHWVETGKFSSNTLTDSDWNARTGYAASLSQDASACICRSLQRSEEFTVFLECMNNAAPFDSLKVSRALIKRLASGRFSSQVDYHRDERFIHVKFHVNILASAPDEFVIDLYKYSGESLGGKGDDVAYVLSKFELAKRNISQKTSYKGRSSGLSLKLTLGSGNTIESTDC